MTNELKYGEIIVANGNIGTLIITGNDFRFLPCDYGYYYTEKLEVIKDFREASQEEKIKHIETEFSWGKIIKTHVIGDYQIIECERNEDILFHNYRNFKDDSCAFNTLDQALIGCIVFSSQGYNSRLETYIPKML